MRIFGLNILTDVQLRKKLAEMPVLDIEYNEQIRDYVAQVTAAYRDRSEQDRKKAEEARQEVEGRRQVQIELQDFIHEQNQEIMRLHSKLGELVEAQMVLNLVREIKKIL